MKRIPVKSSSIVSIGYDPKACLLEVEFKRGAVYHYRQVPSFIVCSMLFADSVGKYFASNVQKIYEYRKVDD